jgi:tetratricopeptide (TPR) repeat protein
MRIHLILLAAILLAGNGIKANGRDDTITADARSKILKAVKIGPEAYILPPPPPKVDSALLFRTTVDERYRNRRQQDITVMFYSSLQKLAKQLAPLAVYEAQGSSSIADLESMLKSAGYAGDVQTAYLVQNSIAIAYLLRGNLEKTAGYLRQSLPTAEKAADKTGLMTIATGLSEIAKLNGNYNEAAGYQEMIRKYALAQKQNFIVAGTYLALADLHTLKNEYDLAEHMIIKMALPMFRSNKPGRLSCFEHLSDLYFRQNRYSEAKWYTLQAKNVADQLLITESQISCLSRLAAIKNAEGDRENALKDLRNAEAMAAQYNVTDRLISIKGDIGDIYRKMGNYVAAGTFINEYSMLSKDYLNTTP